MEQPNSKIDALAQDIASRIKSNCIFRDLPKEAAEFIALVSNPLENKSAQMSLQQTTSYGIAQIFSEFNGCTTAVEIKRVLLRLSGEQLTTIKEDYLEDEAYLEQVYNETFKPRYNQIISENTSD